MKKLFYYLLFPSILFSQTTPSVTPRVDGEGSLGTETYRWGEIYTTTPSIMDNSSRVPNTSWIRDYLSNNTPAVLKPEVIHSNAQTFTAEINKVYLITNDHLTGTSIYLPKITEENLYSEISFYILEQDSPSGVQIATQTNDHFLTSGWPDILSYRYMVSGTDNRITFRSIPSTVEDQYYWLVVESSDHIVFSGTLFIPKSSSRDESLVLYGGESTINKPIKFWWDDTDFVISYGYYSFSSAEHNKTFLSFKDLETSSPYTEFTQPVKAPNPTAADDSTNVATTAWVQDEIATKAPLASPALTGTPTAPTAPLYTDSTQIATTEFVQDGLLLKQDKFEYSYSVSGTVNPGVVGKFYAFGGSGSVVLPLASTCNPGDQIAIIVVGTGTVTISRSGSDQFVTPTGLNTSYSLTGGGSSIVMVRATSSAWAALGAPDSMINAKAAGALLTEATPASSSATGTKGMIRYDADYVYICTATDTWIRIAKDTW